MFEEKLNFIRQAPVLLKAPAIAFNLTPGWKIMTFPFMLKKFSGETYQSEACKSTTTVSVPEFMALIIELVALVALKPKDEA